jgi:hypothetical protein
MRVGIDPKNDYAFKRLFGHEYKLPLLFSLLEAVLQPPPGRRLAQLDLLNPFNGKEALDAKVSILDIKAQPGRLAVQHGDAAFDPGAVPRARPVQLGAAPLGAGHQPTDPAATGKTRAGSR